MPEKTDYLYLNHINDACSQIGVYLGNIDKDKFIRNNLVQDGVIRQLEIIGEAVRKISTKTRDTYKEIDWGDITGMRDKLIHDYTGVDLEIVWKTVKEDVPELKRQIEVLL